MRALLSVLLLGYYKVLFAVAGFLLGFGYGLLRILLYGVTVYREMRAQSVEALGFWCLV